MTLRSRKRRLLGNSDKSDIESLNISHKTLEGKYAVSKRFLGKNNYHLNIFVDHLAASKREEDLFIIKWTVNFF